MHQRFARGSPVRGMLGVGDRELDEAPVLQGAREVPQRRIGLYRRAVRNEEGEAADRVDAAVALGASPARERVDIAGIGREEQLERRPSAIWRRKLPDEPNDRRTSR